MADLKISQLPPISLVSGVDLIAVVDDPSVTPITSRATVNQLAAFLASNPITLSNKIIITPTIASFVNATHSHLNATGGGTITAAAISDFSAAVAATSSVTANTAKITNATHTGDVTGATALTIANNAVTLAKFQDIATASFLGRITAATGDPEVLTGTQATTLLNVFTSSLQGLVPSSGGGTTNFLRADGTFATPAGVGDMVLADAQTVTGAKTFLDTTFLLRNVANSFDGSFVNTNTADRIYTLPDETGIISLIGRTETLLGKTLTTPTIVATGFTNMQHTHQAANTGSQLVATSALTATGTTDSTTFLRGDDTWVIPNNTTALTINRAVITDGSGFIAASAVTNTELGFVSGVTSSIQTQLNKAATASLIIPASGESEILVVGTGKVTFRMPYAFTLTGVRASVLTAPTGSVLTVDINENGTTILSTKITIDATEKTSTTAAIPPVISDAALADDAEITIDIDTIGSTIAGAGLKVYLIGTVT